MIAQLVAVLSLIAVGGRAIDALRTAQLDSILRRLPEAEAAAYYQLLRRRVRKAALLRALALVSLVCIFYVFRQSLVRGP